LRALYFLLAAVLEKLEYLKIGLALVLIFVGAKMIAEPWLKISVELSLAIVIGMLLVTVLLSLLAKKEALR
jgi:tellurite resistance protein TerC